MGNEHTNLQATDDEGRKLSVQQTTDSPILPAANLQQLHAIDPTLVKWVVDQTEKEANYRRTQDGRVNWFIFIERISGVVAGLIVSITGLGLAAYVAIQGHEIAASIIGGSTLATIVTVIVAGRRGSGKTPPQEEQKKKKK